MSAFCLYELGWGATITRVVKPFSFPLTSLSSASGLGQPVVGIVDEADQRLAVRVLAIVRLVDHELVNHLRLVEAVACHLRLDDHALAFQEEVHARARAAVARRPLLLAHVVEVQTQQRVQVVLHVVFVVDHERGAPRVSLGELPYVSGEPAADVLDELEGVPLAAGDLPPGRVCRLERVLDGRPQRRRRHRRARGVGRVDLVRTPFTMTYCGVGGSRQGNSRERGTLRGCRRGARSGRADA